MNAISIYKKCLTGEVKTEDFNRDSILKAAKQDVDFSQVLPNKQDSLLREKVDKEDKYNLFEDTSTANFVLFPPVNGAISEPYNLEEKHFAVDIVVPVNTPVKPLRTEQ